MRGQPTNSGAQPRFLMCRPQYYAVSYSINPWMDPQGWAAQGSDLGEAAHREWAALHAALLDKGATIECVDPKPDLPDLVFTANAAIVLDGKALLSRFRHPERKPEEPVFADALQAQAGLDAVETLPGDMIQEGAGDCIWDSYRGQFWMGCGPRSDRAAANVVADYFAVECVALELVDPSFYHLDTAFCALPTGDVIYYPQARSRRPRELAPSRSASQPPSASRSIVPRHRSSRQTPCPSIIASCCRAAPTRCARGSKSAASPC